MRKFCSVLLCLIVCVGCSSPSFEKLNRLGVTAEEYVCLEKFFRYFMLHETAIYTLLGSKPMTEVGLFYEKLRVDELSDEQRGELVYFLLNKDCKRDRDFYHRLPPLEQEKAYLISEKEFIYPIEDLWDQWEKIQHRFPVKKQFLLIKKEWLTDWQTDFPSCKGVYDVIFVNVLKTALVIQENYELFKQAVGYDFDALEVVFELENAHSQFWDVLRGDAAYQYATLWGLLFGFGKENALCYTWRGRHLKDLDRHAKEKDWTASVTRNGSCKDRPCPTEKGAFTLEKFPIPAFMSFVKDDPMIAKYEAERENIRKLYQGKDFVEYTLELLTDFPEKGACQN